MLTSKHVTDNKHIYYKFSTKFNLLVNTYWSRRIFYIRKSIEKNIFYEGLNNEIKKNTRSLRTLLFSSKYSYGRRTRHFFRTREIEQVDISRLDVASNIAINHKILIFPFNLSFN